MRKIKAVFKPTKKQRHEIYNLANNKYLDTHKYVSIAILYALTDIFNNIDFSIIKLNDFLTENNFPEFFNCLPKGKKFISYENSVKDLKERAKILTYCINQTK